MKRRNFLKLLLLPLAFTVIPNKAVIIEEKDGVFEKLSKDMTKEEADELRELIKRLRSTEEQPKGDSGGNKNDR